MNTNRTQVVLLIVTVESRRLCSRLRVAAQTARTSPVAPRNEVVSRSSSGGLQQV